MLGGLRTVPDGQPVPLAYVWVGLFSNDSVLVGERRVYPTDPVAGGEWQRLYTRLYADSAGEGRWSCALGVRWWRSRAVLLKHLAPLYHYLG